MTKNQFTKVLLLLTLLQVLCVLLIPWRWVTALILCIGALVIYLLYRRVQQLLKMTEAERITRSANLAEENSEYLSRQAPFPLYMYDDQLEISWMNEQAIHLHEQLDTDLWHEQLVPAIKKGNVSGQVVGQKKTLRYQIDFQKRIVYLMDITSENTAIRRQQVQQVAIGFISVDNYDDAIDQMDDKEVAYLNSFVTTFISDWGDEYQIYYKRLNAERFFFTARLEDIMKMEADKFSIVERLRKAASDQNIPLTISMGI